MKNLFLTLLFIASSPVLFAQTVAQDFTKTDCDGVVHHLFEDLDAGNCVFIEFAMMPTCQPCITAGSKIEQLKLTVNAQHPDKVKWYLMEWSGQKTCADIQAWKTAHNITSTPLPNGNTEVDYYGGIGMPTLVLLGGTDHAILWKKLGFVTADTTTIKNRINTFFAPATGINQVSTNLDLTILPNPAQNQIKLMVADAALAVQQIEIFDVAGTKVISQTWQAATTNLIDIANLPKGIYFVQLLDAQNNQVGVKQFVKE